MKDYKKLKIFLYSVMLCSIFVSIYSIKCCLDITGRQNNTHPISVSDTLESQSDIHETDFEQTIEETTAPEPIVLTASIGAMGDLLMHKPIFDDRTYNAAVQQPDGTYNFDTVFQYIAEPVRTLDYAVVNLETTLCGENNGYQYSGYPHFNCPDDVVDGAKTAGFDMLLTANNHSYDTGIVGYKRTLDVIKSKGLDTLGTYASSEDTKWVVKEINGIKIGMLCYTWAYSVTDDGRPSLNGNSAISEPGLCNFFYSKNLDAFYEEVSEYLAQMEAAGAETTIMFIHWGTEYSLSVNEEQKNMAQRLCDMGVDVIIGAHPHVIQPIALLESTINPEYKTVCIYSMGNAVSNQRLGSISHVPTAHTEDGILFSVHFEKHDDDAAYLVGVDVIPTWVNMHLNENGKTEYNILPLEWNSVNEWREKFELDATEFQEAQDSYNRTMEIVGDGLTCVNRYLSGNNGSIQ